MRSRLWLVAALLAGAAIPALGATAACAGTGERAALVVDTGADLITYCVALPGDSVSGLELIELANDQHGLQYRFGDGGQAVCMLANVGAEGDDCFGEYPDFWGFWRGDGSGGWTWSSVGAGSALVRDGDIQGWSWGRGQDGSTHPKPPPTRFEEICEQAAPPQEERTAVPGARQERKASGRTEEPPQKSDVPEERLTPRTATASGRAPAAVAATASGRAPAAVAATASGRPTGAVTNTHAAAAEEPARAGVPSTGLVAIAIAGALGAGGAIAMRRRRT